MPVLLYCGYPVVVEAVSVDVPFCGNRNLIVLIG